jgi:Contractile injection system tube protein
MIKKLEKAFLIRLTKSKGSGKNAQTTVKPAEDGTVEVQFNPSSLRVTYTNNIDQGGATTLDQRRQNPSAQSATLNFDLEFDTAEESDGQGPVDVRTRTANIRQFAEPSSKAPKEPPPLLRFLWGSFSFVGIVSQLVEDMDLFSPEGRPLRAKVSVTMKEVRLDLEAKTVGKGTRTSDNATSTGKSNPSSGAPGSPPSRNPDTAALAQSGESLQQLLGRLNADPAAWRAAMSGLASPLSLPAGAQVQLAADASAELGVGATAGFAAGVAVQDPASLAGALGVSDGLGDAVSVGGEAGASVAGGGISAPGEVTTAAAAASGAAGFVLAEGGGVVASTRTVIAAHAQASIASARAAFEVPPAQISVQATGRDARAVDPRTQTFGRGIPLRPRLQITDP